MFNPGKVYKKDEIVNSYNLINQNMTICIAAISENNVLIGASDRMLTAGDMQYEPERPKILPLTKAIYLMTAGDISIHSRLYTSVSNIVNSRILEEPDNWWNVQDVAELYSQAYLSLKNNVAHKEILSPLGLDWTSWIADQTKMSSDFIQRTESKLSMHEIGDAYTIIVGLDSPTKQEDRLVFQPHIYTVMNESIMCNDAAGFSVIGSGYQHAQSHLMFTGHTPQKGIIETLMSTYQAKRKAEFAPGIGLGTDMFYLDDYSGCIKVRESMIEKLKNIYDDSMQSIDEIYRAGEKQLGDHLTKLTSQNKPVSFDQSV